MKTCKQAFGIDTEAGHSVVALVLTCLLRHQRLMRPRHWLK